MLKSIASRVGLARAIPFSAASIEANDWRQGSVLPADVSKKASKHIRSPGDRADMVLVCSNDCDVISPTLDAEPWVELIPARRTGAQTTDGNYSAGKNPRRLEFASAVSGATTVYALVAHEKWNAPRKLLVDRAPMGRLEADVARVLASWLARRYDRTALPTAFNDRTGNAVDDIKKALRRTSDYVTTMYISLSSLAELEPTTAYELGLFLVMPVADFGDTAKRYEVDRALLQIEAAFADCPGVLVSGAEVVPEDGVSLHDIHGLLRWEADYLSVRLGRRSPIAPRA